MAFAMRNTVVMLARNRAVSNGGAHWVTTGGRYGLGTHSVPFHSQ